MNAQAILHFIEEAGKLKVLPRTGWLLRGLKNPESIADHSYRTTLLAMVLADILIEEGVKIKVEKVMRLALLHDLTESQMGDIPYPAMKYIPEDVKEAGERQAIRAIVDGLGRLGEKYVALWEEFEQATTLEAKLVRAADKVELMIQVYEYEKVGCRSLSDFWENMPNHNGLDLYPVIEELMALLQERREIQPMPALP
jgi:putative hydrolase of HD superfamily